MGRWLQIGILLAAAGLLPAAQTQETKGQPESAQPQQQAPVEPPATPDSGSRPGGQYRMGPPGMGRGFGRGAGHRWRRRPPVFERWRQLTPEQREEALEKLPPARQRRLREQFNRLDRLPEPQRLRLEQRYQRFRNLPPDQQQRIREAYQQIRELPEDRRRMIHREYRYLTALPASERQSRMQSAEFRSQFTDGERGILNDLVTLVPEI